MSVPDRTSPARWPRSARFELLALLAVILAGAALRLYHLAPQVLDGDEVHSVRAVVSQSLPAILTTYQESDNCIPLTALFKLAAGAGARLSEVGFRMPSIVAGLLLLIFLPLGLRRVIGNVGGGAVVRCRQLPLAFASLLALSPLLVFYSRIARSYLPMALCAVAAVAAFALWWRDRSPRYSLAYVLLGGLAIWLHLGAAPFVGAPFLFALGDLLWGPISPGERRGRLLRLALLALGLGLAVLSFLLPARESLAQLIAGKRQAQVVGWETIAAVLSLQAGTASPGLAVLFWLLVLAGLAALWATSRRSALFLVTLAGVQVLGIRLLSPLGLANPLILDRYLLPVVPLVLFLLAFALASPWPLPPRDRRVGTIVQGVLATAFVVSLVLAGPLSSRSLWRSSFMHRDDALAFYRPATPLPLDLVPEPFHRMSGGEPGAVIEYPWSSFAGLRAPALYQQVHRRRVWVSGPQRLLAAPVLGLGNFVAPTAEAFCASGARFLAVHLLIGREEDRLAERLPPRPGEKPMRADLRRTLRAQAEAMAGELTARWGGSTDSVPGLRIWDLAKVCRR